MLGVSCSMEGGNQSSSSKSPSGSQIFDNEPRNPIQCIGNGISRVIHNDQDDGGKPEVSVWSPSNSSKSQEGRAHEGSALLQVPQPHLQLLRVGSNGDGTTEGSDGQGPRGEPRDEQNDGRNGTGKEGAFDPRRVVEGERGLSPDDAAGSTRRCKEHGGHSGGASGGQASGSDGVTTTSTPVSDRTDAQPAHLAHSVGRRIQGRGGDERSGEEPRGDEAGSGVAGEVDGSRHDGGEHAKSRTYARVRFQEEVVEISPSQGQPGHRCGDSRARPRS